MDDKIRQLAEQASHQSPDGYPVTIPYSNDFAKKFAELIAWECVGLCNSIEKIDGQAWECSDAIKQHFGVNE